MKKRWVLLLCLVAFGVTGCQGPSRVTMEKEVREGSFRLKYKLGLSYIQSERYKDALLELLEAQRLNPSSPKVYNGLGVAYLGLGELDKAQESFEKAVTLDPGYSEAHTNLATVYIQRRQWDKAVEECTKALDNPLYMSPEVAYNNRGYAYQMMGKDREALLDYYRALRYNPKFPKAYENLIAYYLSKDDMVRARGILDDTVALGLKSPGLIFYRALFSNIDGDKKRACELFQRLVKEFPLTSWAKKARAYIDLIGNCDAHGATILR